MVRWRQGLFHSPENDNRIVDSILSSYTVFKDGSNYRAEANFAGGTDYGPSDDLGTVVNQAKDAGGKYIFLKSAKNYTKTKIILDKDGCKLIGAGGWGDFHLTADTGVGIGFYPRNATLIVDNSSSGLDPVIQIGSASAGEVIKGVHVKNLAITGKESWTGDTDWKDGSGIKTRSARAGCIIEGVSVYRKDYGIVLGIKDGTPNYTYNNEGMIIKDILAAYCDHGLTLDSGTSLFDSHIQNVRGYYNYRGLINFQSGGQLSHVSFRDIVGQMCGYETDSAGIGLKVTGICTLENAFIDNNYSTSCAGKYGIYVYFATTGQESVMNIISPCIHGVKRGIYLLGDSGKYGTVNITNPYLGIPGTNVNAPLGGKWGITEKAVDNAGNASLEVHVKGGTCRVSTYNAGTGEQDDVADKYGEGWFYRVQSIRDVKGYNPPEKLTTPWNNDGNTVGLYGNSGHSLEANNDYCVAGVDIVLTAVTSTGTVTLYVKDKTGGNTLATITVGTSPTVLTLPIGHAIRFSSVANLTVMISS